MDEPGGCYPRLENQWALSASNAVTGLAAVSVLLATLHGCSSSESAPGAAPPDAGSSSDGGATPDGVVGKAGGTVASSDGKATLIVPADALDDEVRFTITEATDVPEGNLGLAWNVEPTNAVFKTPVTLVLSVSSKELGVNRASALAIGIVSSGEWRRLSGMVAPGVRAVAADIRKLGTYGIVPGQLTKGCDCDVACVAAACKAASLQPKSDFPSYCVCADTPLPSAAATFKAADTYESCSGVHWFGPACTPCIVGCIREAGATIASSDEQVCQWAVEGWELTSENATADAVRACIRSTCTTDEPLACGTPIGG